jgi:thioredoxin reductase
MPKGMLLKSDGFASNISDPSGRLTLEAFCAEQGIPYSATGIPVRLDTFAEYGLAFKERILPDLEDKLVVNVDRAEGGYQIRLEDGELVIAKRLVLAVGITHFEHIPDTLAHLPSEFLSHSGRHSELGVFSGRKVVVIGAGASALDWAGLLHEAGVDVQLVARQRELKFHGQPPKKSPSKLDQIRRPQTGLGPGWRSKIYADYPSVFHHFPQMLRLKIVNRVLGPSGGWFIKEKVVGRVPLVLGYSVERAEIQQGKVRLQLRAEDGTEREMSADHVIAATGYKVDVERLGFLNSEIRSNLKTVKGAPKLSLQFESSIPGLYFAGVAAASSFGPVMRFAYGADFNARTIARSLSKAFIGEPHRGPTAPMTLTK